MAALPGTSVLPEAIRVRAFSSETFPGTVADNRRRPAFGGMREKAAASARGRLRQSCHSRRIKPTAFRRLLGATGWAAARLTQAFGLAEPVRHNPSPRRGPRARPAD